MIPKIIHYCWFGGNPKPKLAEKCIKSWKKYCPDYEIIEWNESNFDISSAPLYVRQAYEAKKWAFVTDYVRLYAMVTYGGIYMDTDVELIKSLDNFLLHEAFSGFENGVDIQTGIMACNKDFPLFREFLNYYSNVEFYNQNGTLNTTTNVVIMTNICLKKGLLQNNQYQIIDGFALYPKEYFCPRDYFTGKINKTKNTVTIHWFSASWHSPKEAEQVKRIKLFRKKQKRQEKIDWILHIPNRILIIILGKKYDEVKRFFGK